MSSTTSSSNLTSGFIDLATFDEPEKYMYGGRDAVSYFVRRVRKATWFTTVPVVLQNVGTPNFNAQFDSNISRAGDYLLYSWLRVTIPSVSIDPVNNAFGANGRLRWTRNLMHNLIREMSITFNDLVEMRFDSWYLDFWSAFTIPAGKRNGYDNMIGNIAELINPMAVNPATGGLVLPSVTLNLPLPICHSRDTGVALPTAALPYNEMRFRFQLRNWTELLILDNIAGVGGTSYSIPATSSSVLTTPVLGTTEVWAEYAIVSGDERKRMGKKPRDILIEQVQTVTPQTINTANANTRYDIHFSHSIKALFFALQNTTNAAEWSNYTAASPAIVTGPGVNFNPQYATDPILSTSLFYENTQRLSNMGSDYFSLVQPFYKAVSIPLETGYHLYSYTLDLVNVNPMGSTNYGKLTNVGLTIVPSVNAQVAGGTTVGSLIGSVGTTSLPDVNHATDGLALRQTFGFIVVAINHNIVRISGGARLKNRPRAQSFRKKRLVIFFFPNLGKEEVAKSVN